MRALRGFLFCFLLLMGAALTYAQDSVPLLDPVPAVETQLRAPITSPQMPRVRYAAFNPQALTRAANVGSQITLNLFDDVVLTSTTLRVDARFNEQAGYVWYGQIDGMEGAGGVMVVGEDSITASFFTPQGHFTIERDASGFYRVTEIAPFVNPAESDALIPPAPPAGNAPELLSLPAEPRATGGYVDVMVLVTPAARTYLGGMSTVIQRAELMVATANQARMNSGVNMHMRLVHVAAIPFTERATMTADIEAVTFNSGEARNLRDQYGADLVTLITKDKEDVYCGRGWLLNGMDNLSWRQQYGYSVVSVSAGSYDYDCTLGATFAHEAGHNMGGSHDHANTNFGSLTPYAYGYQDPQGQFSTIMAYETGGSCGGGSCVRIPYFSTPRVKYWGRVIGRVDWADMTRLLNMTSPFVASFRGARVTSSPLPAFDLVSPVDMTELTSKNTVFTWSAVSGATHYQLSVFNASGGVHYRTFVSASACSSTCSFNTASVTNWNPPAIHNLTWRVRAFNSVYQNSVLSAQKWTLRTRFLPKPVILTTPLAKEIITTPLVTFRWPDDARVEKFRMQILDAAGKVIYGSGWQLADTTLCPSGMCAHTVNLSALSTPIKEGATYRWRVQTSSSSVAVTTVSGNRAFIVDVLPPNITPSTPAPQAVVPTRRPVFTWARATNVTQYRIVYRNSVKQWVTPWASADTLCDATVCTLDFATQTFGLPQKAGEWFVQGRTPNIVGIIRSPARKMSIVLP